IASTGTGLGPLITAPFATFLINSFNWRIAYLVIGIVAWLVVIPLSRYLKRDPYEIGELPDGAKTQLEDTKMDENTFLADLSFQQAFRTRSLLFASSLFLVLTHIVPHTMDIGYSAVEAATILSLSGGATIVGRMLFGIASDKLGRKLAVAICTLLQFCAMLWLLWAQDLWMFYLFAILLGLAWGGMGPAMAALIGDTFGLNKLGVILGVLDVGFSTGAAIGPVIGGLIFDISNSYFLAFSLGTLIMLVATLLITLIKQERSPIIIPM
ncbi:MFS transporter, partial [Chloroflexota bacterium]